MQEKLNDIIQEIDSSSSFSKSNYNLKYSSNYKLIKIDKDFLNSTNLNLQNCLLKIRTALENIKNKQ